MNQCGAHFACAARACCAESFVDAVCACVCVPLVRPYVRVCSVLRLLAAVVLLPPVPPPPRRRVALQHATAAPRAAVAAVAAVPRPATATTGRARCRRARAPALAPTRRDGRTTATRPRPACTARRSSARDRRIRRHDRSATRTTTLGSHRASSLSTRSHCKRIELAHQKQSMHDFVQIDCLSFGSCFTSIDPLF